MFEALFGAEMPLAIRFCVAFLIALGLIGATAWAMLRFGTEWSGGASIHARARAPRLAVVDHASVDESRQLIIVRCDNVEHLLMIGGRTDVVVEANIVRAASTAREAMLPRVPLVQPATAETAVAAEQNLLELAHRIEAVLRRAGVLEIER